MGTEEAGPSSNSQDPSAHSACVHGRMVNDERTADGMATGRLICVECGAVVPPSAPSAPDSGV